MWSVRVFQPSTWWWFFSEHLTVGGKYEVFSSLKDLNEWRQIFQNGKEFFDFPFTPSSSSPHRFFRLLLHGTWLTFFSDCHRMRSTFHSLVVIFFVVNIFLHLSWKNIIFKSSFRVKFVNAFARRASWEMRRRENILKRHFRGWNSFKSSFSHLLRSFNV